MDNEQKKAFFQRLKLETADLHRQTENSRLSVALMSEPLTEKVYTDYLLRMKEVVAFYEKNIFPALAAVIPDIEQRRKLSSVQKDLDHFNITTESSSFSLPAAESTASLLGYMYVLEGSTLGGAFIYKHVNRHLNVTEEQGGAYFSCYQNQLSARWKTFLEIVGEYSLQKHQADEIIAAARLAFEAIRNQLD